MKKILKDFAGSLTSPESYLELMNRKKGNLFLYVFLMVFVTSMIAFSVPAVQLMSQGGFGAILEEAVPDFKVSAQEGLWIEEPVELDEYGFLIKVDSTVVREDITELDGQYGTYDYVIMADREKIHLQVPGMQEITARYDEMTGFTMTKADVLAYVPVFYMASLFICILSILVDFGYYFVIAAFISWLAGVLAAFMKVRIGNVQLFKMAVYAGTMSYMLSFLQMITGIQVPNFGFFSYVITLGYMFFAVKEYRESMAEAEPQ